MKCSFCGVRIKDGTGTIFVKKTGKTLAFCTSKCEKNMLKLGRKPVNFEWAKEGSGK